MGHGGQRAHSPVWPHPGCTCRQGCPSCPHWDLQHACRLPQVAPCKATPNTQVHTARAFPSDGGVISSCRKVAGGEGAAEAARTAGRGLNTHTSWPGYSSPTGTSQAGKG